MKKLNSNPIVLAVVTSLVLGLAGPIAASAAGPAAVNLGSAGSFVILAKAGVSTTGTTSIVGDIGVSPVAASSITGFGLTIDVSNAFSTSALVTGKIYAADYTPPTPTTMTTAVSDMQTAYTDAAGRTNPTATELGAGNIGGMTLAPGLYKWGTGVAIPTSVTLAGGPNDVWIFQVAQNLIVSSGAQVILSGGAQASNIFWQVAGQTTIGTTAVFNGTILDQTAIVLNTGAQLNGRALAQTAVTLDSNAVRSAPAVMTTSQQTSTTMGTTTSICQYASPAQGCSYVQGPNFNATSNCGLILSCPTPTPIAIFYPTPTSIPTPTPTQPAPADTNSALQTRLSGLVATLNSLQTQARQQGLSVSASDQQIRSIATNLGVGSRGSNVTILQQFLISQNKGQAAGALANAGATAYFGSLTQKALAEFQTSVGISPALGNFGPVTRTYLGAH